MKNPWLLKPLPEYHNAMTKRERVKAVLKREPVDAPPVQASFTSAMAEKLSRHFGQPVSGLPRLFNNHLLRVDISFEKPKSPDGAVEYDFWGAGFNAKEEGYFVQEHPLADLDELSAFPWPNPAAPGLLNAAAGAIKAEELGEARFIIPNFGFALFERAWSLRGLENFMVDY